MVVVNAGMLLSIPAFGGHYLMDVLAGAAVMLVSLALTHLSLAVEKDLIIGRFSRWVEKAA